MNWLIRISDLKHRESSTPSSIWYEQDSLPTFGFIWIRCTIGPLSSEARVAWWVGANWWAVTL